MVEVKGSPARLVLVKNVLLQMFTFVSNFQNKMAPPKSGHPADHVCFPIDDRNRMTR